MRAGPTGASSGSVVKKDNPPKAPSRAFQMSVEEARETADVVSGTFLVNYLHARVLFDSGADRSFVSNSLCQRFTTPTTTLSEVLVVEVSSGELVVIRDNYEKCTIELDGEIFVIDLLPISLRSFDVVVGMDWLAANRAEILCYKMLIKLP